MSAVKPDRLPPGLLQLVGVVMLGALMMQLDMTMTTIATNTLLHRFDVTLSTLQWVGTGYLLAMASVIPLAGWSLERFGARAVWMFSLAAFLAGSILCGLSWSVGSLIAFRVIQGIGGGLVLPIGQAVLAQAAGPERIGRVMAAIGIPSLLGPVLGPVLGGLIVTDLSWRWIFYVNVPICLAALVLSARIVPTVRMPGRHRLDVGGLALISLGCVSLIYGFAEAGRSGGFTATRVVVLLAAGAVLLAAFVVLTLRSTAPLIDLRLLRNRPFAASSGAIFLAMVVLFGALGLLPLYYQQVRGDSPLHTGLLLIPFGVGMGLSLAVAGRAADRMAPRGLALCGLALSAVGALLFTRLGHQPNTVLLSVAQLVAGAGVGGMLVPIMAAGIRGLPGPAIPRATTAMRIFQQLGGSFGSALLFVVLQRQIAAHGTAGSTAALGAAFGSTFWWPVGFTLLAAIPILLLPGRRTTAAPVPSPTVATE